MQAPFNRKRERGIAAQNGSFNVLFASGLYPLYGMNKIYFFTDNGYSYAASNIICF